MKMMKRLSVLLMAVMMMSCMAAVAFADDTPVGEDTIAGRVIPYGMYVPTETELATGSHGVKVTCPRVHVTDVFTAEITFSSMKYTKLVFDDVEYKPYIDQKAKAAVFEVPVPINQEITVMATTEGMSAPMDIPYTFTVKLDTTNPGNNNPAERGTLTDGYYTTTVPTKTKTWGWTINKKGELQYGYLNPENDYDLPVTIKVENGMIADVAYTQDPNEVMVNTSSDFNYLLWTMEGHNVDAGYAYLSKAGGNYEKYHLIYPENATPDTNPDMVPAKCGTGMRDQFIGKSDIAGVDTVTAATVTSRAVIDSVDKSLTKAERGQKDDPAPVLPTPDTSDPVIPKDGVYIADNMTSAGARVDNDVVPAVLYVNDGKITADLGIRINKSSYPKLYPGLEPEAIAAGEDKWFEAVNYDYGYTSPGSLYKNLPIKSLDKPVNLVIKSKSSGNWFNRLVIIPSAGLKKVPQEADKANYSEATYDAIKTAYENYISVRDTDGATVEEITAAKDTMMTALAAVAKEDATKEAEAAVNKAKKIKSSAYTAASYKKVQDALGKMKKVLADPDATAEEINTAKDLLEKAIKGLKTKKANTLKVKASKTKTFKVKALKKKAKTFKAVTVSKAQGTKSYKISANKKAKKALKFAKKTGKITVKKGTKKGTYKMKITVKAAGNGTYKSASKTVTVVVKVKK